MMRSSLLAAALAACIPDAPPSHPHDEWDDRLGAREVDYSAALRVAALRLTGELPTLDEIDAIATAGDVAARGAAYAVQIRRYLDGPRFARQMFRFAQDLLKLGDDPLIDTAPAFLAKLVVEDRSYLDVLTATGGTCPSFDPRTGAFTPGECRNGVPAATGLLTHPGMHAHYFGNLAFRRVRWVQETFACSRFPAELAATGSDVGGSMPYTGKFPFASIAGRATGGRVDFQDVSSVICANCHSNMNHIAPLFARFDERGQLQPGFAVPVPLPDNPTVEQRDYLPASERLAWRFGVPITDMASLGAAMAADPAIAECIIARVWNWAMGKPDLVDGGARVPGATIEAHVAAFVAGGHRLRDALYRVFTSDDFVRF